MLSGNFSRVITIGATVLLAACAASAPTLEESLAAGDDGDTEWIVDPGEPTNDGDPAGAQADAPQDPEGSQRASVDGEPDPAEADEAATADEETVPDLIDEEYFSEIANGLLALLSDSLRDVVGGGDVYAAEAVHHAVLGPGEIDLWIETLHEFFHSPEGRQTQLPPDEFGVQRFEVYELIEASEDCMAAFGRHDLSETSRFPFPPEEVALFVLARSTDHDTELNPVGWRIWDTLRLYSDGEPLPIERVAEIDNLEDVADLRCADGGR